MGIIASYTYLGAFGISYMPGLGFFHIFGCESQCGGAVRSPGRHTAFLPPVTGAAGVAVRIRGFTVSVWLIGLI